MKKFLISEYDTLKPIFLTCALSIFLVFFRMKISHDLHHLFLIWNLFLAFMPLCFAYLLRMMVEKVGHNKIGVLGIIPFLVFLPNAPYILTDFIHLTYSPRKWFGFDLLMILSFAVSGLFCALLSIKMVYDQFFEKKGDKFRHFAEILTFILCGYGVYLGRFWRYNSWHLITHPFRLVTDCFATLMHPITHQQVWLFTLGFGGLLYVLNYFIVPLDRQKLTIHVPKK